MDDKMDFVWSAQDQRQPSASTAGQDLHQYQVGQWLHSSVLGSTHRNQHTPPSIPSSPSFHPAEIQPQQHNYHHYQPAAGFNGPFTSSPLFNAQPVVQQTPPPSSTACFPLDREQFIEHQFQKMHQLLQLQYQQTMESINHQFHLFSLYWSTRQQSHNQLQSSPTITQQQGTSYQAPHPNVVDTTAAINEQHQQQSSMDQLFVPASTTATTVYCDDCDQQQQQQTRGSKISFPVPTPDGSDEREIESAYTQQSPHAPVVLNSFHVGSFREAINTNQYIISIKSAIRKLKFLQHFLDRNGHRMDSVSGRASVLSDVFKWMINHGGTRIKLR
ncbi:uncharacterized protein LOC134289538 [Aedes albopictus]|uniref:Uncharacterized protein n=1 Tax=Aedes albopictus TaxID=7160 RepID=A0ABM2A3C2_AEDAL